MMKNPKKLIFFSTLFAVIVAGILVVFKTWAWLATGSISMQASLVDSIVDCVASFCATLAVKLSHRPAKAPYSFGFGKIQPLVALIQSLLVAGSAIFLGTESLHRLFDPQPLEQTSIGFFVMILSTVLTLVLVCVQRFTVLKTQSVIVSVDSLHYQCDLLMNLGVVMALFFSQGMGFFAMDSLFGLGISFYILAGALRITRKASLDLLDRELPSEETAKFLEILSQQPVIEKVLWVKTRKAGASKFLTAGVRVRGMPLLDILESLRKVKQRLEVRDSELEVVLTIVDTLDSPQTHAR